MATYWGNTKCNNCGQFLSASGICPNATPTDANLMRAPVSCNGAPVPKMTDAELMEWLKKGVMKSCQ